MIPPGMTDCSLEASSALAATAVSPSFASKLTPTRKGIRLAVTQEKKITIQTEKTLSELVMIE